MQPEFRNRPPAGAGLPHIELVRAPSAGALIVLATSRQPIATPTHWWQGQTLPCIQEACIPCQALRPKDWHVYFAGVRSGDRATVIVELTREASQRLYDYLDSGEPLRGSVIKLERAQKRANGRVIVTCDGKRRSELACPEEIPLEKHLMRIWFGDDDNEPEPGEDWGTRIAARLAARSAKGRKSQGQSNGESRNGTEQNRTN